MAEKQVWVEKCKQLEIENELLREQAHKAQQEVISLRNRIIELTPQPEEPPKLPEAGTDPYGFDG